MRTENFDFKRYAIQVRQFTRDRFLDIRRAVDVAGCMHLLTVAVERDLKRFGDPATRARIACQPGCSTCCVVNVAILGPEAIAIAWNLKQRLLPAKLNALTERTATLAGETRWLDEEERLCLQKPCAFLDAAGWCSIHPVRPLLCRSMTSLDAADCREAVTAALLGERGTVLSHWFQKELFETAYYGLGEGLAERGLDDRPYRLAAAVCRFLAEDDATERYLAGERLDCH